MSAPCLRLVTPFLLLFFCLTVKADVDAGIAGYWVDRQGRGVLEIAADEVWLSRHGERPEADSFQLLADENGWLLQPDADNKTLARPASLLLDDETGDLLIAGRRYRFTRPPDLSADTLDGFWYEDSTDKNIREVRSLHYQEQASHYDYHFWEFHQTHMTWRQRVDENVPLQLRKGFIFTAPGSGGQYVHYAVGIEGDTIHYVDRNGVQWSETRSDSLFRPEIPSGYREFKPWMMGQ